MMARSERGACDTLVCSLQVFSDRLAELPAFHDDLHHRYPESGRRGQISAQGEGIRSDLRDILTPPLRDVTGGRGSAACEGRVERARLALETCVTGAVEMGSEDGPLSEGAVLDLYQLLGAYRGVLEAMGGVSESVQAVDGDNLHSGHFLGVAR